MARPRSIAALIGTCQRVDVNIHLLADVDWQLSAVKTIDGLQDSRVHALGAFARERYFRNHVGFKPDKLQGSVNRLVAAKITDRSGRLPDPPGIVLIHIDAHIHWHG